MLFLFLALAGCDTRKLTDPDFELPREFEPPVPTEPGDAARPLLARSPMHPFAFQAHADPTGVWVITLTGDGFGFDLRPEPGEGLELHRLEGGEDNGSVTLHPGPPLDPEGVTELYNNGQVQFLPAVESGHLAFWYAGELYRFDGASWDVESWGAVELDPSIWSCLGVGPERSVWVRDDGEKRVVEDGVERVLDEPPGVGPVQEWVSGPFDGRSMRVGWTNDGELCTALWDLRDDVATDATCLDLEVPLRMWTPLGGTQELSRAVVSVDPPEFGRFMLARFGEQVVVEGALDDPGPTHRVVDHPQHDWFVFQPPNPAAQYPVTQMILADGSFTFVGLPGDTIVPADECPCAENDPFTCWCIPRTLMIGSSAGQRSPLSYWNVAAEIHDGVRYVWADLWTDPEFDTTIDPDLDLLPFDAEDLLDTIQPFVQAPGWTGYVDLNDCRTVLDGDGLELLPDDQGRYLLDDFQNYEIAYEGCQPPDGGPPLLPVTGVNPPGGTEAFDLTGASLGRGWPVEPADDPPQVVVAVDHPLLILRETTGWTLIEQDGAGIVETTIDTPAAASPRILSDGRVLLAGGGLFDPSSAAVGDSVDLLSTPEQTRGIAGLLVDDSPAGLRIHDLTTGAATTVVDEPGARTAELLDVSDDGLTLLETDGQTVWVRRPGVGQVDLGSVQVGLRRARLSADGSVAVVGLQTSATSVQESSLTAWALSVSTGLTATEQTLCTTCAAGWAFDRSTGAVLGPRTDWASGLSVYRPNGELPDSDTWAMQATDIADTYIAPPSPFTTARHSTDAYGWAWWSGGLDLVGFDFATDSVSSSPVQEPNGELRSGPDGLRWLQTGFAGVEWYRLEGPDDWVFHHRPTYDAPIELSGGRAAQVALGANALQVGSWSAGDPQLTGPIEITRFQPELLADVAEPRFAGAPCVLYALESQPGWVTSAPTWACVR